jgi:uncharacterized protein (UPF0276 family)
VTFLGAGVGYRRAYRPALLGDGPRPDLLEVTPEDFFAHPEDLDVLAERYPLVFHCAGLSVGTAVAEPLGDDVTRAHLGRLRDLVRRVEPIYVSDHLAFRRAPNGTDLGHFCPLPYGDETYELVSARVRLWQDALELPIVLENIAHPFLWPGDTMSAGTFFERLSADTDCGLLLDLSNLLYDARNFGRSPGALLREFPLGAVRALHLAGGAHSSRDRFWNATHDHAIDEEVFTLLPALRGRAPLLAAIVERDHRLPPLHDLLAEANRASAILRGG